MAESNGGSARLLGETCRALRVIFVTDPAISQSASCGRVFAGQKGRPKHAALMHEGMLALSSSMHSVNLTTMGSMSVASVSE